MDGKKFSEKVDIETVIGRNWKNPTSYKIANAMAVSLEGNGPLEVRRAFEHEYFQKRGYREAIYSIEKLEVDPLQYYKNKTILSRKNYGELRFVDQK